MINKEELKPYTSPKQDSPEVVGNKYGQHPIDCLDYSCGGECLYLLDKEIVLPCVAIKNQFCKLYNV